MKPAVTDALLEILAPVQEEFNSSAEWQEIALKAYPPAEIKKKVKKAKNLGTKFPGGHKNVEAKPDGHVEGPDKSKVDVSTGAADAMQNLDSKLS